MSEVESVQAQTAEIDDSIANLNQQQAVEKKAIKALKKQSNETSEEIASEKYTVAQVSKEVDALKSQVAHASTFMHRSIRGRHWFVYYFQFQFQCFLRQVVRSPERIKKTLSRMTTDSEKVKASNTMEERAVSGLQLKLDNLEKLKKVLCCCLALIFTVPRVIFISMTVFNDIP
jgi:hypothetical protein